MRLTRRGEIALALLGLLVLVAAQIIVGTIQTWGQ